jgi:serine/threonine-protein kinase
VAFVTFKGSDYMTDLPQLEQPKQFKPPTSGLTIFVDGSRYVMGEKIGQGYFGAVYACSDEWGNDLVAKVLIPRNQTYDEVRESCLQELQKLRDLRHPNITYLHNAFESENTFYLVIERCTMTLNEVINMPNLVADQWIPYVARDVLQAVGYLHSQGYVHKDIHPGNVFVSLSVDRMVPTKEPVWSFKLGDLGISRLEGDIKLSNTLLAQWMLPPEIIDPAQFGAVGRPMDIYHVGLLLLALLQKKTPAFTRDEVVAGAPRALAEAHGSKYAPVIAKALRRHVAARTPTAMEFWREISAIK